MLNESASLAITVLAYFFLIVSAALLALGARQR